MAEKKPEKTVKKAAPVKKKSVAPAKKETPVKAVAAEPASKPSPAPSTESHGKKALPGIGDLFKASWELFKKTFFSYFKVVLAGIGLFLAGVLGTVLLTLPLMLLTGGEATRLFDSPSALEIVLIVLLVAWMLVSILAFIYISILLPIIYLMILDSEKKLSLKELFLKAKGFFWPLLFIELLVGVAVLGGLVVLIVPGVLFAIYFTFAAYAMLFENFRGVDALKRSYALVKNNFWEIVIRVLILQAILFAISYIFNSFSEQSEVITFVSIVFSFATEWFSAVFMYLVYKHIRDRKAVDSNVSLSWIWIIAGIGLVLGTILIGTLASAAMTDENLMRDLMDPSKLTDPETLSTFE